MMKNFLWFFLHLKAIYTVLMQLPDVAIFYADIMLQLNRLWIDVHYIARPPAGEVGMPSWPPPPLDPPLVNFDVYKKSQN